MSCPGGGQNFSARTSRGAGFQRADVEGGQFFSAPESRNSSAPPVPINNDRSLRFTYNYDCTRDEKNVYDKKKMERPICYSFFICKRRIIFLEVVIIIFFFLFFLFEGGGKRVHSSDHGIPYCNSWLWLHGNQLGSRLV